LFAGEVAPTVVGVPRGFEERHALRKICHRGWIGRFGAML
jgi:hypothetical protein